VDYTVEFKPRAVRDVEELSPDVRTRVWGKIALLRNDLGGDVKRLTNYSPRYRLRVGDYRVLFDVDGSKIIVYRVLHRREAYDR
jgi:mRNA interferase RelE/StbE